MPDPVTEVDENTGLCFPEWPFCCTVHSSEPVLGVTPGKNNEGKGLQSCCRKGQNKVKIREEDCGEDSWPCIFDCNSFENLNIYCGFPVHRRLRVSMQTGLR